MENFASSTFAKILVGSAFLVGGGIYLYNSKHNALDEDNFYEQITLPSFSSLFI